MAPPKKKIRNFQPQIFSLTNFNEAEIWTGAVEVLNLKGAGPVFVGPTRKAVSIHEPDEPLSKMNSLLQMQAQTQLEPEDSAPQKLPESRKPSFNLQMSPKLELVSAAAKGPKEGQNDAQMNIRSFQKSMTMLTDAVGIEDDSSHQDLAELSDAIDQWSSWFINMLKQIGNAGMFVAIVASNNNALDVPEPYGNEIESMESINDMSAATNSEQPATKFKNFAMNTTAMESFEVIGTLLVQLQPLLWQNHDVSQGLPNWWNAIANAVETWNMHIVSLAIGLMVRVLAVQSNQTDLEHGGTGLASHVVMNTDTVDKAAARLWALLSIKSSTEVSDVAICDLLRDIDVVCRPFRANVVSDVMLNSFQSSDSETEHEICDSLDRFSKFWQAVLRGAPLAGEVRAMGSSSNSFEHESFPFGDVVRCVIEFLGSRDSTLQHYARSWAVVAFNHLPAMLDPLVDDMLVQLALHDTPASLDFYDNTIPLWCFDRLSDALVGEYNMMVTAMESWPLSPALHAMLDQRKNVCEVIFLTEGVYQMDDYVDLIFLLCVAFIRGPARAPGADENGPRERNDVDMLVRVSAMEYTKRLVAILPALRVNRLLAVWGVVFVDVLEEVTRLRQTVLQVQLLSLLRVIAGTLTRVIAEHPNRNLGIGLIGDLGLDTGKPKIVLTQSTAVTPSSPPPDTIGQPTVSISTAPSAPVSKKDGPLSRMMGRFKGARTLGNLSPRPSASSIETPKGKSGFLNFRPKSTRAKPSPRINSKPSTQSLQTPTFGAGKLSRLFSRKNMDDPAPQQFHGTMSNTPNLFVVLQVAIQRVNNATVLDHLVEFSALMLRLMPRDFFPAKCKSLIEAICQRMETTPSSGRSWSLFMHYISGIFSVVRLLVQELGESHGGRPDHSDIGKMELRNLGRPNIDGKVEDVPKLNRVNMMVVVQVIPNIISACAHTLNDMHERERKCAAVAAKARRRTGDALPSSFKADQAAPAHAKSEGSFDSEPTHEKSETNNIEDDARLEVRWNRNAALQMMGKMLQALADCFPITFIESACTILERITRNEVPSCLQDTLYEITFARFETSQLILLQKIHHILAHGLIRPQVALCLTHKFLVMHGPQVKETISKKSSDYLDALNSRSDIIQDQLKIVGFHSDNSIALPKRNNDEEDALDRQYRIAMMDSVLDMVQLLRRQVKNKIPARGFQALPLEKQPLAYLWLLRIIMDIDLAEHRDLDINPSEEKGMAAMTGKTTLQKITLYLAEMLVDIMSKRFNKSEAQNFDLDGPIPEGCDGLPEGLISEQQTSMAEGVMDQCGPAHVNDRILEDLAILANTLMAHFCFRVGTLCLRTKLSAGIVVPLGALLTKKAWNLISNMEMKTLNLRYYMVGVLACLPYSMYDFI